MDQLTKKMKSFLKPKKETMGNCASKVHGSGYSYVTGTQDLYDYYSTKRCLSEEEIAELVSTTRNITELADTINRYSKKYILPIGPIYRSMLIHIFGQDLFHNKILERYFTHIYHYLKIYKQAQLPTETPDIELILQLAGLKPIIAHPAVNNSVILAMLYCKVYRHLSQIGLQSINLISYITSFNRSTMNKIGKIITKWMDIHDITNYEQGLFLIAEYDIDRFWYEVELNRIKTGKNTDQKAGNSKNSAIHLEDDLSEFFGWSSNKKSSPIYSSAGITLPKTSLKTVNRRWNFPLMQRFNDIVLLLRNPPKSFTSLHFNFLWNTTISLTATRMNRFDRFNVLMIAEILEYYFDRKLIQKDNLLSEYFQEREAYLFQKDMQYRLHNDDVQEDDEETIDETKIIEGKRKAFIQVWDELVENFQKEKFITKPFADYFHNVNKFLEEVIGEHSPIETETFPDFLYCFGFDHLCEGLTKSQNIFEVKQLFLKFYEIHSQSSLPKCKYFITPSEVFEDINSPFAKKITGSLLVSPIIQTLSSSNYNELHGLLPLMFWFLSDKRRFQSELDKSNQTRLKTVLQLKKELERVITKQTTNIVDEVRLRYYTLKLYSEIVQSVVELNKCSVVAKLIVDWFGISDLVSQHRGKMKQHQLFLEEQLTLSIQGKLPKTFDTSSLERLIKSVKEIVMISDQDLSSTHFSNLWVVFVECWNENTKDIAVCKLVDDIFNSDHDLIVQSLRNDYPIIKEFTSVHAILEEILSSLNEESVRTSTTQKELRIELTKYWKLLLDKDKTALPGLVNKHLNKIDKQIKSLFSNFLEIPHNKKFNYSELCLFMKTRHRIFKFILHCLKQEKIFESVIWSLEMQKNKGINCNYLYSNDVIICLLREYAKERGNISILDGNKLDVVYQTVIQIVKEASLKMLILIPIHHSTRRHWTLLSLEIDPVKKTIFTIDFDPLEEKSRGMSDISGVLNNLSRLLKTDLDWELFPQILYHQTQQNETDCGAFIVRDAEMIIDCFSGEENTVANKWSKTEIDPILLREQHIKKIQHIMPEFGITQRWNLEMPFMEDSECLGEPISF